MTPTQVLAQEFAFVEYAGKVESCPHGYEDGADCPLCGVFDTEQVEAVDGFCEERGLTASPAKKAQVLGGILGIS